MHAPPATMVNAVSSRFLVLLAMTLLLSGCAHYQSGTPTAVTESPDRLYLAPVVNRSYAPQIRGLVSQELHGQFSQSAGTRLVAQATGAWQLLVVLGDYQRDAVATRPEDTGRALSFDLQLAAYVTLISPDGSLVLDQELITADTTVYSTAGLVAAEHDSMPLLARVLAQRIRTTIETLW